MPKRNYNIGLDIGTSSIGWTIVDDNAKIMHVRGKNGYGVRIFSEGQTAADRRGFRTTRRRLKRRKWRLRLLQEIFEPYILPIDENFFMRQKESNLVPQDPNKHFTGSILFNDRTDQEFHEQYPTIYHLRYALMTEHHQFDIREIYWAIHHIVKYRGHFLTGGSPDDFKSGDLELEDKFKSLNTLFTRLMISSEFQLRLNNLSLVHEMLVDSSKSRLDRQRELVKQIYAPAKDKQKETQRKNIATNLLKAVLGLKVKLNVVLNINVEDDKAWTVSFNSETVDDVLSELDTELNDDAREVIDILRSIHSSIMLAGIIPPGKGLSESMMDKYEEHKKQLIKYKILIDQLSSKDAEQLKQAYDKYINGVGSKPFLQDDFYKDVHKVIDKLDDEISDNFKQWMDVDNFLPKQRTKANGSIPHQMHQRELDEIIENQKKYYPWLAELNPNETRRKQKIAKYKLDELVAFRIPYYIGPLIDPEKIDAPNNTKFAWMSRKENGAITPWNFDQKVDRNTSAERFIKRMTTKDTYLINEDVLPKKSLLYQRFEVLNELNNVRVNNEKLTTDQKQAVYGDLFKRNTSVTKKRFKDYLQTQIGFPDEIEIKGLASETKFLSGLTTENDLRPIFGNLIDDPDHRLDIEKIIEWATIFEDSKILRSKLDGEVWLTDEQKEKLSHKRYRGWGNFSRKLLAGLVDGNGQRIIDLLWDSSSNFMVIVSRLEFKEKIEQENQEFIAQTNTQDVINDLYTSPQNKKALRQILLIVKDIQKAMKGQTPDNIFIEFARGDDGRTGRSVERRQQIEVKYQEISNDIIESSVRDEFEDRRDWDFSSDRLFLYFMQGGWDPYTGNKINIDDIFSKSLYDIDHILPQAFIKDDSLDNRVLVSAKVNRIKSNRLPEAAFSASEYARLSGEWSKWKAAGIINERKFNNLTFSPDKINKYQKEGFVKRQLVETRQVIKLAANLLADEFSDQETQIVSVKAGLTHQMRENFDFPKNRDVNNYHHAFDAYLTAFVGNFLLNKYPKLKPYFVYGEFPKGKVVDQLKNFNLLRSLEAWNKDKRRIERSVEYKDVWDYLDHIYDYKKVTVTHEVRENSGAMFNQTLYKASDDKASGRGKKKLIAKKENMPTELYGGYSGSTDAFMSIVRLKKKDKVFYKVVGIPTRVASKMELKDKTTDLDKLNKYLVDQFTQYKRNKRTGEITKIVEDFKLVVPKVLSNQKVLDGGQAFTLGSSTYRYNAQELYLPKDIIRRINISMVRNGDSSLTEQITMLDVYQAILEQVDKYFPMYDINGFRGKLKDGITSFKGLPDKSEYENNKLVKLGENIVINRILIGLHANAATSDLKDLKMNTPFGKMQQMNGITLSSDFKLVYESPTGLFEKVVSLQNIE
ncbi:type II CRISPR RNA-guided endonuclease Cas9 [Paucilactobacillus kaifaensis]|uniref:type II CRISPR RNA-guided endonuclease Cas9 n=1 Tax=Paucilactobacillus kaifaensis TaxID=2559921 RepID=UPI001CC3439F|nr:type II CRISPR RNA-guided endonuclease Cas9 [Paucilactobacillus kaifaensis]